MKQLNLLNILILVIGVLFSTQEAFSQASTVQTLSTSVQTAVAVEKISSSETGSINPSTGEISGSLTSSFNLQTNDENSYDFIVYSSMLTADSQVSAFDINGNLLFGNTRTLPLSTAVANAKLNQAGNANVIVYPFKLSLDENMSAIFTTNETYNESYKINFTNSATSGSLIQTISGSPVTNTYSIGEDTAGTYKATVYITAVAK